MKKRDKSYIYLATGFGFFLAGLISSIIMLLCKYYIPQSLTDESTLFEKENIKFWTYLDFGWITVPLLIGFLLMLIFAIIYVIKKENEK